MSVLQIDYYERLASCDQSTFPSVLLKRIKVLSAISTLMILAYAAPKGGASGGLTDITGIYIDGLKPQRIQHHTVIDPPLSEGQRRFRDVETWIATINTVSARFVYLQIKV